jgi:hypothetical protein
MCRHHLEDLGIDGKDNIKMDVLEVGWCMDLIDVAEDMDKWQAVLNTVLNFLVL